MSFENYINLRKSELDKPVYRIMPVHRLLECFQKRELVLVPPAKWDDPFENMLLDSKIKLASGEIATMSSRDQIYGLCWTLYRETDAMWRIYSADKNGAKVKSTPRKLLRALQSSADSFRHISCFIGRVGYMSQKNLIKKLRDLDLFDSTGVGMAESLMYKRVEFKHEKEVRLVHAGGSSAVHAFQIEPEKLFDEVVLDPRMDLELFEAYKAALNSKGFTNPISQSSLYKPPKALTLLMSK